MQKNIEQIRVHKRRSILRTEIISFVRNYQFAFRVKKLRAKVFIYWL